MINKKKHIRNILKHCNLIVGKNRVIILKKIAMQPSLQTANSALWEDSCPEQGQEIHTRLPTKITGALTQEQLTAYQIIFRIEEITSLLRSNNLRPPERRNRSPSPSPVYDARGKRINTKEQRYGKKLEEERHRLVELALKLIPHFVAPEDYKRPTKFQDKYYIPVNDYPDINFVGLLLGPRGNTLRKLQEASGCKIAIRGRGSVKEGKNAYDLPRGAMNFSDPLHCLVIADNEDKIHQGIKLCEGIVIKAVTSPEGQNDLKRGQLRELAELNGILREDNRPCTICGLQGHKRYDCPNMETFAQKVICRRCGQPGHVTIDCATQLPLQGNSRYNPQESILERPHQGREFNITSSYRSRHDRSTQGPLRSPTGHRTSPSIVPPGLEPNDCLVTRSGMSSMPQDSPSRTSSISTSYSVKELETTDNYNMNNAPSLSSVPGMDMASVGLSGPPGLPSNDKPPELNLQGPPGSKTILSSDIGDLRLPPGTELQPSAIGYLPIPPGSDLQHRRASLDGPPGLKSNTPSNYYCSNNEAPEEGSLSGPPGM